MAPEKKEGQQQEEQKWDNPLDPEKTGDSRDQEQLMRQYKEAKRRHDNLTENTDNKKTK